MRSRWKRIRYRLEWLGLILATKLIPLCSRRTCYRIAQAAGALLSFVDRHRYQVALSNLQVAFGDLFLEDVRRYREERLAPTGLRPLFPLWGRPTPALAEEMIASGLQARLTCVDPRAVPASLAGRAFDRALLADLPPGVDPCGERGEFHSFTWAGPMFRHPVPVRVGAVVSREGFVFADLLPEAEDGHEAPSS